MPARIPTTAIAVTLLAGAFAVNAQTPGEWSERSPEDRRAYRESLSDDERASLREQLRAQRDAMSDEERAALREKRRARRDEHWQTMSADERAAAREKMRDARQRRRAAWEAMPEAEREAQRERLRALKEERRAPRSDADQTDGVERRGRHDPESGDGSP